jgi:hypothetical protein
MRLAASPHIHLHRRVVREFAQSVESLRMSLDHVGAGRVTFIHSFRHFNDAATLRRRPVMSAEVFTTRRRENGVCYGSRQINSQARLHSRGASRCRSNYLSSDLDPSADGVEG